MNLTPHTVNIVVDGVKSDIPASGLIVRCAQSSETVRIERGKFGVMYADGHTEIGGTEDSIIPFSKQVFGKVEGMPAPQDGVLFIVSSLVASELGKIGRTKDILGVGCAVRDEQNRVIGTTSVSIR